MESFLEDHSLLIGVCIASVAFVVACLLLFRNKGNHHNSAAFADPVCSTSSGDEGNTDGPIANTHLLRNVFSVKQKPTINVARSGGNTSNAKSSSTSTTAGRPFESSYYFAHNGQSTGGGYKDGLSAEDYVMNGPRLLSKGGVPVISELKSTLAIDNDNGVGEGAISPASNMAKRATIDGTKRKMVASSPIVKYMWDDDGNGNIAKIHIDCLPISSTKSIKWEDAGISSTEQIEVRLIGNNNEGLYIGITSHDGRRRHHLHVPKMYGEAESVKAIPKRHKLIVKITKKTMQKRKPRGSLHSASERDGIWTMLMKSIGNAVGGGAQSGNDEEIYTSQSSWPRLSASSAGGLGGGSCEIDEKLFKKLSVDNKRVDDS